jgi:hypothetical protein
MEPRSRNLISIAAALTIAVGLMGCVPAVSDQDTEAASGDNLEMKTGTVALTFYSTAALPSAEPSCAAATKTLLAGFYVELAGPYVDSPKVSYQTDAQGVLRAKLAPGQYAITVPGWTGKPALLYSDPFALKEAVKPIAAIEVPKPPAVLDGTLYFLHGSCAADLHKGCLFDAQCGDPLVCRPTPDGDRVCQYKGATGDECDYDNDCTSNSCDENSFCK